LLPLVIVIVIVIPLSLALCLFLLLRRRRLRRSYNQDQGPNTSSVKAFFSVFYGKAKKSLVLPFTVKKTLSPSSISHLSEKGMTLNAPPPPHRSSGALHEKSQEEAFRSGRIPSVTPVESPNEAIMTSERPFQSPYDGDVSHLPEKVVAMEANLQQQMNVLQDRLGDVEQEIASSSSSPNDPHPSAEDTDEILALRQLVEDLRREMHTLRARDMRFSGLMLDEPPPQYQPG
jgi:hypothetical protein